MSLLKRLFGMGPNKELEAKSSAVGALKAGASATHWVGLGQPSWTTRSYEQLSTEGYRKNVIAHRAVKTVAEAAASVPFQLYHGDQLVGHHPLLDLLARPNPLQSGVELLEVLYSYLQIAGNGWLESVENATGSVGELYTLRPDRMHIVPGQKGFPVRYDYKVGDKTHRFPVDFVSGESAVLHLKTFHPTNDWYGLSPLEAAAFGIDIHNAASGWNKALFDNAARPSGALVFEPADGQPGSLSDDQFNRLKGELESHYMGSANAGRPFLLEGGLKWQQIAFSPADMEFINAKHVSAREIALAFGVPPMLLGIPGDNTYANYAEANRALWRLTLLPLLEKMVSALNGWLAPRFGADLRLTVDRDSIPALQGEREALWARIGQAGFLTINEKRAALGFPPVDGGDELPNPCGVMPPDMGLSGKGDTPVNFKQGLGASASSPNACLDWKKGRCDLLKYEEHKKEYEKYVAREGFVYLKTWRTTGSNPRSSHSELNGKTIKASDRFNANGVYLRFPQDKQADGRNKYSEICGCQCTVEYDLDSSSTADGNIAVHLLEEAGLTIVDMDEYLETLNVDVKRRVASKLSKTKMTGNEFRQMVEVIKGEIDRISKMSMDNKVSRLSNILIMDHQPNAGQNDFGPGGLTIGRRTSIRTKILDDEVRAVSNKLTSNGHANQRTGLFNLGVALEDGFEKLSTKDKKGAIKRWYARHEFGHQFDGDIKQNRMIVEAAADYFAKTPFEKGLSYYSFKGRDVFLQKVKELSGAHESMSNVDKFRLIRNSEKLKQKIAGLNDVVAEAFAWYTSNSYPHHKPNHPKRLPRDLEDAFRKALNE